MSLRSSGTVVTVVGYRGIVGWSIIETFDVTIFIPNSHSFVLTHNFGIKP